MTPPFEIAFANAEMPSGFSLAHEPVEDVCAFHVRSMRRESYPINFRGQERPNTGLRSVRRTAEKFEKVICASRELQL